MAKGFNPMGASVILLASSHSLEGEIRPGEDGNTDDLTFKSVGTFYVPDWEDEFTVFYCAADDDYYIFMDDDYVCIGWGGDWDGLGI